MNRERRSWLASVIALAFSNLGWQRVFGMAAAKPAATEPPQCDQSPPRRKPDAYTSYGRKIYWELQDLLQAHRKRYGRSADWIMITPSMEAAMIAHMETWFGVGSRFGDKLLALELRRDPVRCMIGGPGEFPNQLLSWEECPAIHKAIEQDASVVALRARGIDAKASGYFDADGYHLFPAAQG